MERREAAIVEKSKFCVSPFFCLFDKSLPFSHPVIEKKNRPEICYNCEFCSIGMFSDFENSWAGGKKRNRRFACENFSQLVKPPTRAHKTIHPQPLSLLQPGKKNLFSPFQALWIVKWNLELRRGWKCLTYLNISSRNYALLTYFPSQLLYIHFPGRFIFFFYAFSSFCFFAFPRFLKLYICLIAGISSFVST